MVKIQRLLIYISWQNKGGRMNRYYVTWREVHLNGMKANRSTVVKADSAAEAEAIIQMKYSSMSSVYAENICVRKQ